MSIWESIYKYESTTIQNDNEYKDILDEIKKEYGYAVIEIWSNEYLEKLKNCNGYNFQKTNKNFDDLINEKMNVGDYSIWPLREELLKNENIFNFYYGNSEKSKAIEDEERSKIKNNYLNKKRKNSLVYCEENNASINLENYRKLFDEMQNKIKEYEKIIEKFKLMLLQKDKIIENEKKENYTLMEKLKELENSLIKNLKIRIIELENEIKLFRKHYNFSEGEKLIAIKFISSAQDINYSLISKNTEKFLKIEYILYEKYPKYTETVNYFLSKGNKINRNETLVQNNIKNNDIITVLINNID